MTNTPTRPETMVERVARAIEMLSLKYALRRLEGMEDSDPGQGIWEEFARAAIEEMREPTESMVRMGDEAVDTCTKVDPCLTPAKHIWADMITEALGEGK